MSSVPGRAGVGRLGTGGGGARRNRGTSANGSCRLRWEDACADPMAPTRCWLRLINWPRWAPRTTRRRWLRGRLRDARLRMLVAGEAKRGKSTLVNALLGRDVLPAGVTPLTALPTTVRYGQDENVSAVFTDGRAERFPLAALEDLVTERRNPANCRQLSAVTVLLDVPVLARGVKLVDTPGTGSVNTHNTAAAEAALETMDAAVFVLTADPPMSASERELMARVADRSVRVFLV
jgi:hypothetical protein